MINEHFYDPITHRKEQIFQILVIVVAVYAVSYVALKAIVGLHDWLERRAKSTFETRFSPHS